MSADRPFVRTLADIEAIEQTPLEERMEAWTVPEILAHGAAFDPGHVALHYLVDCDPEETPATYTYADVQDRASRVANLFHGLLSGPKGVVGVLLPLVPENYFILFGGPAAGVLAPVNWMLRADQIGTILEAAGAELLVTLGPTPGFDIWEKAVEVAERLPAIKRIIQVKGPGGTTDTADDFDTLILAQPGDVLAFPHRPAPGDTAIYCHTGGTTGTPKLAPLLHRGLAYKCHAYGWVLGHGPDDVVFAGTPLFHSGGIVNRTMSPFFQGMTNVILSPHGFRNKNSVKHYWRLVARYGETELIAVPTILSALANMPPGDIDISSLKPYANTGSAGMPAGLARTLEEKLGIAILSNYGLTENTASAAVPPRSEVRHGSSGMRIPYTQIKTLRVDGAGHVLGDCKPDEIGAIAVKGPGVIEGYVDPALNHDLFFDGGWLNTGDLGRIDAEGYLWVTGRIKDLIIRGGNNIDPQQIDEALLEHDAVELAAAVGKPDGYAGEMPVAYVQLKEGAAADPEEIREFARARIPERAAVPAEIFIIDPMPLTEVGKIYKPPLRRDAARRAFEAALAPLVGNGVSVSVEVRDDPAMGTLAAVTLSGDGDRAALAEKAAEILGAFTLAHEVAWA